MADSSEKPWSNHPNAPRITYFDYVSEKSNFAGFLIGAMLYGIVVVLFFQCMSALFNPANDPRGKIRWGLVAHTAAMFSFVTVYTATTLDTQSISYIDNRKFPGADGWSPGPLGYQFFIYSKPITVVPSIMFAFNQWLADGLLLYRCYVIYSMNFWVIAFPCLMYLTSLAMGIAAAYYQISQQYTKSINFGIPYFSSSLSLNILLTLMIVTRLVLRRRNLTDALGPLATPNRLYKTIITMLVESCALYAASSVLNIGPWCTNNPVQFAFFPILVQTQVIAPLLIVLRVANHSALTKGAAVSGDLGSLRFNSQGASMGDTGTIQVSEGNPMSSTATCVETRGELGVGAETTIDARH